MFVCPQCGTTNPKPDVKFCINCGFKVAENAADFDRPEDLKKYLSAIQEIYFDADSDEDMVRNMSLRLRQRFRISHARQEHVFSLFGQKKASVTPLMGVRLEFDENVVDAFAGHDTHLRFRITNNSAEDLFKVSLFWDDPETPDDQDLRIVAPGFVKPGQPVVVGGTHVFQRSGPKEISNLRLTIENQYAESATFVVAPFGFRVGNIDQKVYNNISTHNQISIEGRGVVDASGMGTGPAARTEPAQEGPRWKLLRYNYALTTSVESFVEELIQVDLAPAAGPAPVAPPAAPVAPVATPDAKSAPAGGAVAQPASGAAMQRTLNDEVIDFYDDLTQLAEQLPAAERGKMVPAAWLSLGALDLLKKFTHEDHSENILGLLIEDPSQIKRDADGTVLDFDCNATMVSTTGLTVILWPSNDCNRYAWNKLPLNNYGFYRQRFGSNAYVLNFGEEANRSCFPGMKFDLRRYQGDVPIEQVFRKIEDRLDAIFREAPLVDDPEPECFSPFNEERCRTPAMKQALTRFSECLDHFDLLCVDSDFRYHNRPKLARSLVQAIAAVVPVDQQDDEWITGLLTEEPGHNVVDDQFELTGFHGSATLLTLYGTVALKSENGLISLDNVAGWESLAENKLAVWADRTPPPTVYYFGLQAQKTYLWGGRWTINTDLEDTGEGSVLAQAQRLIPRIIGIALGQIDGNDLLPAEAEPDDDGIDESDDVTVHADLPEGDPDLVWDNGDRYYGPVYNGLMWGTGAYYFSDSGPYAGQSWQGGFRDGMFHGLGGLHFPDGRVEQRVYVNNQNLGEPEELRYADGAFYRGGMHGGVPQGFGHYMFPDDGPAAHQSWVGQMKDGRFHGIGDYTFADGTARTLVYVNGTYLGDMQVVDFPNGDQYFGSQVDGRCEGYGIYKYAANGPHAGFRYEGCLTNGQFQGEGAMKFPDGTVQEGWYEGGNYVGPAGGAGGHGGSAKSVDRLIADLGRLPFGDDIFTHGNIPAKKLNAAVASYGQGIAAHEVLVLIDSTVFGGAKEGLMVTATGLYAKDIAEAPRRIAFADLRTVEYQKGVINSVLVINGMPFLTSAGLAPDGFRALCDVLAAHVA